MIFIRLTETMLQEKQSASSRAVHGLTLRLRMRGISSTTGMYKGWLFPRMRQKITSQVKKNGFALAWTPCSDTRIAVWSLTNLRYQTL